MSRGLLVTGTDTGVGKTLVSCALLRALARRGHRVGVYKPAETGVPEDEAGELRGEDCARLAVAAGQDQVLSSVAHALYPIPAAPLVAAEAAGESIDPDGLVRRFEGLAGRYEAVWTEGAGGLLVPIAPGFTYAELAQRLDLPVLLVVGSKLGCINHALLTLSELERRGVAVLGYVLNELSSTPEAPYAVASHRDTLARFTGQPDLGLLPCVAEAQRSDDDALARLAEAHLDVDAVEAALGLSPATAGLCETPRQ
jgi:dethiobiotin synthetase